MLIFFTFYPLLGCYVSFTCPGLFTSLSLDTGQSLAGEPTPACRQPGMNLHACGALPMKVCSFVYSANSSCSYTCQNFSSSSLSITSAACAENGLKGFIKLTSVATGAASERP